MKKEVQGRQDVRGHQVRGQEGCHGGALLLRHRHPQGGFFEHQGVVAAVAHRGGVLCPQGPDKVGFGLGRVSSGEVTAAGKSVISCLTYQKVSAVRTCT